MMKAGGMIVRVYNEGRWDNGCWCVWHAGIDCLVDGGSCMKARMIMNIRTIRTISASASIHEKVSVSEVINSVS